MFFPNNSHDESMELFVVSSLCCGSLHCDGTGRTVTVSNIVQHIETHMYQDILSYGDNGAKARIVMITISSFFLHEQRCYSWLPLGG